jgi:serine O-acetyltransferase
MAVNSKNVMKYIKSDVFRYYGKCSTIDLIKYYLKSPLVRFHFALRLASSDGICKKIGKIMWMLNRTKRRIDIHYNTIIQKLDLDYTLDTRDRLLLIQLQ